MAPKMFSRNSNLGMDFSVKHGPGSGKRQPARYPPGSAAAVLEDRRREAQDRKGRRRGAGWVRVSTLAPLKIG